MSAYESTRAMRLLAVLMTFVLGAAARELPIRTQANVMVEVPFSAARAYSDPFNQVTLDVVFTPPQGAPLRVPAFWAGGNTWKVRYASSLLGVHQFRSECSEPTDRGLNGIIGSIEVQSYSGANPLCVHGPLRVSANARYLEFADHTPFFWLADTWWMGLCHRLHWPEEFRTLTADRKQKGFDVIQIVAGLYPDMPPFDPRGANEAGFPWETNYSRIRPEYFDAADQRLGYLVEQGFTPCIVGAWGYFLPWMGIDKMKAHWRYLIARYAAWPVVWCAAGEGNLPWYLAPGFPYDDRKQVRGWTEVMRYIRATDPFHRLLTIHPTAINFYTARHATQDPALLDFDLLQTPHGQQEAVPVTVQAVRDSYAALPRMPVLDGEASYEMLGDSLPTEWTRRMFWLCLMNGAAGHTYGANGIWQCNRPGQPHGKSPHGGSYGIISWNEAMHLPGSRQMGLAKAFLMQYPWHRFEPHPEWAVARLERPLSLDDCTWIWFPEGDPARDAPAAKRYFRLSFVLPRGKVIDRASLRASGDDWFSARLNGNVVGEAQDWPHGHQFDGLGPLLKPGSNVLALVVENKPTTMPANPAGLLATLQVWFTDGTSQRLVSGPTWRCARTEQSRWDEPGFDDTAWSQAQAIGKYGDGPWGKLQAVAVDTSQPQATGLPGTVRIVYVPEHEGIELRGLSPNQKYTASSFDPVSGSTAPLGLKQADNRGLCECAPPSTHEHDWVLVLEPKPN